MKEGWKLVKLGDICYKISDGSHNPPKGVDMSQYIMLSSQNIKNGSLDFTSVRYLSPSAFEIENKRTNIKRGDVLLTIVGTIGRSCVVETDEKNITFQRSVAILKPKEDLNSYFLMYLFWGYNEVMNKMAHGAAQKGLYLKQLSSLQIPLPPLSEQQSIVAHLDASFAEIDALKAKAAEEVANAKAMFDAALREEMTPKEDFPSDKLVNVFNFIDYRGATPTKLNSGIPLVTAKNVKKGYIDYTIKDYISETEYSQRQSRGISHKGDILFTTEAPLGNVALADLEVFSAGQRLITFQQYDSPKYVVENKYYMYYFLSSGFQTTLNKLATGATAQGIKAKILKEVIIPVPPISTQQRIVAKLDTLRSHLTELEQKYNLIAANCDALKQAILRETFE